MNLFTVKSKSLTFLIIFSIFYNAAFSQTGFVFGEHGVLLKTTNGGANWVLKNSGTSLGLWNSYFINEHTGWVAGGAESGGSGILLMTTDYGESWIQQSTGITNRWYTGVFFVNPQTGCLIGEHGTIMKTTNAGANWNMVNSGITNALLETIIFTDSLTGWITGWGGTLLKTSDGGANWTVANSGTTYNLYTGFFQSAQTGFLSGTNGTILKTTNQGANCVSLSSGTTQEIFSIFFRGNSGWIAGNQGTLRYTTDAGNTWAPGAIITTARLETIDFMNLTTGWVVGGYTGSVIFKSTDGGLNWTSQNANTTEHLWSVSFYVPPVGIEPISGVVPSDYNLPQNYPNPFNPTTRIRFDVPAASALSQNVILKIYNELGEEAASLLNGDLKPGTYEIEWNASGFSSGTYFCKLTVTAAKQSGSVIFTKTTKMILSK